jgi:hypothetical protein
MKRAVHCLYDIETIGGRDGAPIVQLGAVLFSPWGTPADFATPAKTVVGSCGAIQLEGCAPEHHGDLEVGVISSPQGAFRMNVELRDYDLQSADWSTIKWWLSVPGQAARQRVFGEPERHPIGDVLRKFAEWVESWGTKPAYWWADLDFDCRLMRQAYENNHLPRLCPFGGHGENGPHRGVRDYRTLRWIGKSLGVEQAPRVGVEHDALDDAYHQAYYAIKVLRHLGVEREV